jgi:peptidyl-prolyl cis-trans isomerase C
VKTHIRMAVATIATMLCALFIQAHTPGQTQGQTTGQTKGQTTGQTQAKPTTPAQTAKPPAKVAEPDEPIPPAAPNALFPALVARVNGKPVLGRDLEGRVRSELATIGNPSWKDLRDDYKSEVTNRSLSQLIGDELLYQKALESGLTATQAEIQAEFDKVAKTYPSDAALNSMLVDRGLDRKSLMRDLGKNLAVQKYINETIAKKLVVAPAELTDYYKGHPEEFKHPELVRTSHILITVAQGASADQVERARQIAQSLLDRAKKGEDFAKLAKENSMDSSASQGGDIGMTQAGELAPEYEEAVAKLQVGEISGLVRTQFGFHIIKLMDRKKAGTATLDEVRSQLTDFLKNQKQDADLAKVVKGLQSQAKIEILISIGSL